MARRNVRKTEAAAQTPSISRSVAAFRGAYAFSSLLK